MIYIICRLIEWLDGADIESLSFIAAAFTLSFD